MEWFPILQILKDFLAVPMFVFIALSKTIHGDREVLCLFFAFGCFVDTVYSCIGLYYPILTIARVKDFWGMFGMWVFTFVLAFAPKVKDPGRWPIFFWFAAAVDFISICSVFVPGNIYKKPVVLKTT
jgi:hypothetical protein